MSVKKLNLNVLGGSEAQWTLNGFDVKTITTDRLHFVTRQYGDNHRLRIMNIDPSLSGEYAVRVSIFSFNFFFQSNFLQRNWN